MGEEIDRNGQNDRCRGWLDTNTCKWPYRLASPQLALLGRDTYQICTLTTLAIAVAPQLFNYYSCMTGLLPGTANIS
jgi:hypothetical protein